jgi:hypothetical protein
VEGSKKGWKKVLYKKKGEVKGRGEEEWKITATGALMSIFKLR